MTRHGHRIPLNPKLLKGYNKFSARWPSQQAINVQVPYLHSIPYRLMINQGTFRVGNAKQESHSGSFLATIGLRKEKNTLKILAESINRNHLGNIK